MECPVCYCDTNINHLVCGHQLCTTCTNRWQSTCPMCREPLCFRGIVEQKKQWKMERRDQVYMDIMNELMTDCPEDCVPFLSRCLSIIQERYVFVLKNYPGVDAECMEIILRNTWIPLEVEQIYFHDIPTFLHYIFVNRTEYHNLSSSQYIKFQVEMDLFHKLIDLIDQNSENIPDGDYLQMCDTIQQLRKQVKPPSFLLDQNQPLYLPTDTDTNAQRDREQLHQRWRELDENVMYPGLNEFLHEDWVAIRTVNCPRHIERHDDPVEPGAYYPPPRDATTVAEVSLSE